MTRGPLADPQHRIDFLQLDASLEGKGPSCKNHREDEAQKRKDERDFRLGEGDGGRSSRGLALGADSQKDIVLIA